MRFFRDHANGHLEDLHPGNFPHIFAVCCGITSHPMFQILRIERVRGYDEYATYRFMNEGFDPDTFEIIHERNHDRPEYGQMEVLKPYPNPNERTIRLRFQIQNIFLASRNEVFPVVLLDTLDVLPTANTVVIPGNNNAPRREYYHAENDPNFINNYIMDVNNFRIVNHNLYHRSISRYFRHLEQNRENGWFDYPNHIYNDIPEAERMPFNRERERERNQIIVPHPFRGAGAAAGSSRTTRRDSVRVSTPPRTPAPAVAATPVRPVSLQAFTIQALINHAIAENMTCPISMNVIQKSTACVTSCQHIFERDSIQHWLADHSNCPVCRQATSICN